jgi:hypothetical protein
MSKLKLDNDFYIFLCPNCFMDILVYKTELNCQIFRHGIYKDSYKQIDPHLSKILCDELVMKNQVIGCAKPFEIIKDKDNDLIAVICDYK